MKTIIVKVLGLILAQSGGLILGKAGENYDVKYRPTTNSHSDHGRSNHRGRYLSRTDSHHREEQEVSGIVQVRFHGREGGVTRGDHFETIERREILSLVVFLQVSLLLMGHRLVRNDMISDHHHHQHHRWTASSHHHLTINASWLRSSSSHHES